MLLLGIGVYASVSSKKGLITVQTGNVVKSDLDSVVTASGEVKPKNYINIGANAQGELKEILVKEGDRVRKGQLLARIENVQPEADVDAQRATLNAAEADSAASEAQVKASDENTRTMATQIEKDKADLDRMKAEFDRSEALFKERLISKQDYDLRKFTYEAQLATIKQSEQRLVQARVQREQAAAGLSSAQKRIAQYKAVLVRFNDILQKHNAFAPIDGVITNLPVRTGEIVVPGIQNSAASTIMTIADMSLITAEVKVDETDIVNVKLGQSADVTIDAI
ncbi:MAG TPA: efflux RND transporter periplasmic adaptor subunit, partial [Candidatus Solibacter sp.]|nr:efflux RND transporter periplasmic adaptor subunit [Candidatus Solibacter sp.]